MLLNDDNFNMSSISYCKIHPGIGIARLGNSLTEYFIGPESQDCLPQPKGGLFKDKEGRVKRQAVRSVYMHMTLMIKLLKNSLQTIALLLGKCIWQIERVKVIYLEGFISFPSHEKRNPDIVGDEEERKFLS